ncbi:MAG TPA: EamA family transporter, partial [Negativicutes bacterium]
MKQTRVIGISAILLTSIFWGLSFISIKITVAVIPPMTLALLRFLVAASVLFAMLRKLEPNTRMARQDMPLMAVSGLSLTAYFFFQNVGIQL